MLTTDLIRKQIKQGEITPRYIDPTKDKYRNHAETLIHLYQSCLHRNRGDLEEAIKDWIGDGTDYLIQKGLAKLLADRSTFEVQSPVSPIELRQKIFEASAQHYPVALVPDHHHQRDRQQLLCEIGASYNLSADQVEAALYADLQDAHILQHVEEITPEVLLDRYNLAQAQALLFRASRMSIELRDATPQRLRQLMRYIKFFRLIATARPLGHNHYLFQIDGPLSLFRFCQKYGVQMATFLPALLLCDNWHMEADIQWEGNDHPLRFFLDSDTELKSHYPDKGVYLTEEEEYFRKRWEALNLGWSLEPHTHVITLGSQDTLITDYVLKHPSGKEIMLVILGFWQKHTLLQKLEWIQEYAPANLIMAAPLKLRASQEELPEDIGHRILFYKDVLPPKKIVAMAEMLNP